MVVLQPKMMGHLVDTGVDTKVIYLLVETRLEGEKKGREEGERE